MSGIMNLPAPACLPSCKSGSKFWLMQHHGTTLIGYAVDFNQFQASYTKFYTLMCHFDESIRFLSDFRLAK